MQWASNSRASLKRSHDFLWRAHIRAPGKGEVVVYNRSHYEDVLIVRVHKLVPPIRVVRALRVDQ